MSLEKASSKTWRHINTLFIDEARMMDWIAILPLLRGKVDNIRLYGDRT